MSVLLIAGSPSLQSRSSHLLDEITARLAQQTDLPRLPIDRLNVRDLSPQALVMADWNHPCIQQLVRRVQAASVLVIASPVYKAAYSGVLKTVLDLLPQTALNGKIVLPLATGGSPHHMLALDYALRPVLQSLGSPTILPGVYAIDAQVFKRDDDRYGIADELASRLDEAVRGLIRECLRRPGLRWQPAVPYATVQMSY